MAISDDWMIFYEGDPNLPKRIVHVDGELAYGSGSGTAPTVGEYVKGATSGAIGQVIVTDAIVSGTLSLTNVVGRFQNSESISILSELNFDAVTSGGFEVGDTIAGNSSGSTIPVEALEYNYDGAGGGTIFGSPMSAAFTNNEQLDISGGTADVADADGVGTDNDAKWSATTTAALTPPGTTDENDSVIIHYDGGTIDIPEGARIQDPTSTAEGYAQQIYGATATGSVRVVDSDTTGGTWANNNTLRILDCVYYDNLIAGKVFSVGDVVTGFTSGATGRVLAVIDDGNSTGKLILAGFSGTWTDSEKIQVGGTDIADVEDTTNKYLDAATLNLPTYGAGGIFDEQLVAWGGIYPAGSLNIVRSSNALYTYIQDTFDELNQLDDDPPIEAKVKDQVYVIVNDYVIPPLSFRFLENGSWNTTDKNNYWTNIQVIGDFADIGDHGFLPDATDPTPLPNMYLEQDGVRKDQWYLPGRPNILVQNKTSYDPKYITTGLEGLGQLIDDGNMTIHCREYLRNYDWNSTNQLGGVAPVSLGTADDIYSITGTHEISYTGTGGFTAGEEIVGGTTGARGIVTDEDTGTDDLYYVLKYSTQFGSAETITGQISGATCTFSAVANWVAGYNSDIRIMTITDQVSGGTTTLDTFIVGEPVTQAVTGATGWLMEDDGSDLYIMKNNATAFSGNNDIDGDTSGAKYSGTLSYQANQTTVPKDLGDGSGAENYTGVISADITDADAQLIAAVYEWMKYETRSESTSSLGTIGNAISGVEGRLYKALYATWPVVKFCPIGSKAGTLVQFAQGWFMQKETLDTTDIQNFTLINNAGTLRTPPNLQALLIQGLPITGVRVEASRTATLGGPIQRTEFDVGAVGGGYNQSADTKILFAAGDRSVGPIPADVPDTGVVRILDPNDTGNYLRFPYDTIDRTNNWVELTSGTIGNVTGGQDLVATDDLHVEFISETVSGTSTSNTMQYVADIYIYWVARLKGYEPANGTATFGSTGATVNVQMSDDDIVDLP
jgi:hypothetical protein